MPAHTSLRFGSGLCALLMLLFAFTTALPARAASGMLADTDLSGDVYRSFELIAPVPDFCRKVCEKDEGCRAWTFSWPGKKGKRAKCFLKRTVAEKRKDTCCVSGYKERSIASTLGSTVRNWLRNEKAAEREERDSASGAPASVTPDARRPQPQPQPQPQPELAVRDDTALDEKRDFCRRYAQAARDANRAARRLACGFRGGLWGASFNGYFNWCMQNSPQAAERNTQRRAEALRSCRLARERGLPDGMTAEADHPPVPPAGREYPPRGAYDAWLRGREMPPPAARELRRRAPYAYSWLKRSGPGPRMTPWRPSVSGKCPLVRACSCPQGDTCRVYEPGSIAVYWPLGCEAPPAYVICRVRRR